MQQSIIFSQPHYFFAIQLISQFVRYALFAGGGFLFVWILGSKKFALRKIQKAKYSSRQTRAELWRAFSTAIIFSLIALVVFKLTHDYGWFRFYPDWSSHGTPYALFSFAVLLFLHDTFFYWSHRFMHLPKIYKKVHLAHHTSYSPTPFTIYSFHPLEAMIEGLFVPLVALFLPLHFYVVVALVFYSLFFNLIGHLGHELYGKRFIKSGLFQVMAGATHHDLHHAHSDSNYGFYFRFWDRICGTENPKYEENFKKIINYQAEETQESTPVSTPATGIEIARSNCALQ